MPGRRTQIGGGSYHISRAENSGLIIKERFCQQEAKPADWVADWVEREENDR